MLLQMSGFGAFILVLILLIIQFLAFIWVSSTPCLAAKHSVRACSKSSAVRTYIASKLLAAQQSSSRHLPTQQL
jgi:hypothetical protein